jgi:preprotein translocase subunit SecA/nephrocystin-3
VTISGPHDRVVRVFISSTFRDMQADREELVKQAFPRLRQRCERRGVVWGEFDLRWGITDEQKAEGQVLPICLTQIGRCRPFFIGLLGERYG